MKEFIEKLIGKLEEYKKQWMDADYLDGIDEIIGIVNQLAEEYKDINIITKYLQYVRENANNGDYDNDNGWSLADLIDLSIKFCDAEEYNNGWIPCSERLPEDGGYYLVVYHDWSDGNYLPKYDDVRVKVMHYQVKDLATGYSGWNYPRTIGENADLIEADQHREVTHWKSLPSLPYQPKGE